MSDDCRRYDRPSDWLYKFVSQIAAIEIAVWGERDIEMALRYIKAPKITLSSKNRLNCLRCARRSPTM
jgi:hypothetical protein